jgi:Lipocalin-like domain
MCVELMNPTRPIWKNDEEHATDAEKVSAASGFTAYCGVYTTDEMNRTIVHSPDVAFLPNYIGTSQKRPYRLEGRRLIFSGAEPTGDIESWSIVWEKAGL